MHDVPDVAHQMSPTQHSEWDVPNHAPETAKICHLVTIASRVLKKHLSGLKYGSDVEVKSDVLEWMSEKDFYEAGIKAVAH